MVDDRPLTPLEQLAADIEEHRWNQFTASAIRDMEATYPELTESEPRWRAPDGQTFSTERAANIYINRGIQEAERRATEEATREADAVWSAQHGTTGGILYQDISAVIAGGVTAITPTIGSRRTDGAQLLYSSAVNALIGDPESGKTLVASAMAADTLTDGGSVLIIDVDHNGAPATVKRFQAFGIDGNTLSDPARFRYSSPETPEELDRIVADASTWRPTLVVVDSLGEVIPIFGGNSNDADEYTAIHRRVLTALANTGASVLVIDHLAKGEASRGFGGTGTVAKKRAIDGVMLRVSVLSAFAPGRKGSASLNVVKDRHGGVRRVSPTSTTEPVAAVFVLDSWDELSARWELYPGRTEEDKAAADVEELRRLIPAPTSVRDVKERMSWRTERAAAALRALRASEDEGQTDAIQ